MLAPTRTKFRKLQKGSMPRQRAKGGNDGRVRRLRPAGASLRLGHGAPDRGGPVAITRQIKRGGKIYIRMFPDKPITKKPAETRMGKGKGAAEDWVAVVRPGRVMYEIEGVDEKLAREAFHLAHHKLPIPTRFVARGRSCEQGLHAPRISRVTDGELDQRAAQARRGCSSTASGGTRTSSRTPKLIQTASRDRARPDHPGRDARRRASRRRGQEDRQDAARQKSSDRDRMSRRGEDASAARCTRRELTGMVTSDKMEKTVVVTVDAPRRAPPYHKYVTRRVKYKAHDENNECQVGDQRRDRRVAPAVERQALARRKPHRARRKRRKGD